MKNKVLGYILLLIISFTAIADANAQKQSVDKMRSKATALRKEIEQKEAILLSSQKNINSRLSNLKIITAKIDEYKGYVKVLQQEVRALDNNMEAIRKDIKSIDKEIDNQEDKVEKSRAEYAEALRKARRHSSFEDKLMFIFSADDFGTMARRYRYANNYMDAHLTLADSLKKSISELEEKKSELQAKREELENARQAKVASLKEQEAEKARIQKLEKEQRSIINGLNKEKSKVEAELKKKRDELNKLNAAIKREVEKIVSNEAKKSKETGGNKSAKDKGAYSNDAGVEKMSGNFQNNKTKLPVPITGAYLVTDKFGEKNAVEGKGSVMINNGGITFKGVKGAKARAVFEGTVSTVFNHNDYICVLIRHGKYISVYCNVTNVCVKGGDKVKAGDIIGDVAPDAEDNNPNLLFQLYKERTLLNPGEWLKL